MQFHTENQTNFDFDFHGPQSFQPEYLPETVTPYFVNKTTITQYTKQSWLRRFINLPKITFFVLDSLEKNNEFSLDLHNSVKQTQHTVTEAKKKVDKLNDKISALEGIHGDFQPLLNKLTSSENFMSEKFRKIEEATKELATLRQQMSTLKNQNRMLWPVIILSVVLNLICCYYLLPL